MSARRRSSTAAAAATTFPLPSSLPLATDAAATPLDDNDDFDFSLPASPRDLLRYPSEPSSQAPQAEAPLGSSTSTRAATASSSSSRRGPSAGDEFEMSSIKGQQHRRRKSSLMGTAGHSAPPPRPGRSHPSSLAEEIAESSNANSSEPWLTVDTSKTGDDSGGNSSSDENVQDDEEMGLTDHDRRRKQKKRKRNTRLDQRIAREKNLSSEDRHSANKTIIQKLAMNMLLILLWYTFSLSISLYNKWMFDESKLNFPFPLFTTSLHMVVQFALSSLVLYLIPSLRPQTSHSSDAGRSRHESEPNRIGMTKMFYLTRIGPCGAATGLDIGLGNMSLKVITLTFYTMCKSSSLAFVLLFAFAFRLEKPTWRLVAIIATMTLGVILMVFGEVEFKLGGFILVISAAFFSGFRWGLTQILLLRNPATSNPFSSIFFLSPVMFVTLLVLAVPVEGFGPLFEGLKLLSKEWGTFTTPLFLLFPGCIAFLMTASEFALLQRTSVVTLSIAGIFKEVVTISAASVIFQDELTPVNFIGLITTIGAIGAYNYVKISKMREEAMNGAYDRQNDNDSNSLASHSASDVDNDDSAEETAGLLHQSVGSMREATVASDIDSPLSRNPSPIIPQQEHRAHHGN